MGALRTVLATSIHDVFLVAAVVAFGGVLVAVFLPEKPLCGRQPVQALVEAGKELTAEGVGTAPPIPTENEPRLYVAEADDTTDRQSACDLQPVGGRARDGR
jgi:hypothetical protein